MIKHRVHRRVHWLGAMPYLAGAAMGAAIGVSRAGPEFWWYCTSAAVLLGMGAAYAWSAAFRLWLMKQIPFATWRRLEDYVDPDDLLAAQDLIGLRDQCIAAARRSGFSITAPDHAGAAARRVMGKAWAFFEVRVDKDGVGIEPVWLVAGFSGQIWVATGLMLPGDLETAVESLRQQMVEQVR